MDEWLARAGGNARAGVPPAMATAKQRLRAENNMDRRTTERRVSSEPILRSHERHVTDEPTGGTMSSYRGARQLIGHFDEEVLEPIRKPRRGSWGARIGRENRSERCITGERNAPTARVCRYKRVRIAEDGWIRDGSGPMEVC